MPRLIDADLECAGRAENDPVRIALQRANTVYAEPIRHAQWVQVGEPDQDNNIQCQCSGCGSGDLSTRSQTNRDYY